MGLRTIFVARHGYDSAWDSNKDTDGNLLIPPTGIPGDTPLSSHGILQSKELAHYLLSLDTQPDLVVSSPYYRCVETAHYVAKLLDVPLYTDRGIGQWFEKKNEVTNTIRPTFLRSVLSADQYDDENKNDGIHPPSDVETLNKLFRDSIKTTWKDCVDPYLKKNENQDKIIGETKQELHERTRNFLQLLGERVKQEMPDAETILLITHAPVKISLGLNLLGYQDLLNVITNKHENDSVVIRSGCCSLDKYESDGLMDMDDLSSTDSSLLNYKWRITMNGNTVFLRNGEEKPWYFKKDTNDTTSGGKRHEESNSNKDEEKEDTETIYVSLDLNSGFYKDRLMIERNATFQYSGLNQDKPLFRIGNKLYEGTWRKLVGTELAFPNEAVLHKRNRNTADNKAKNINSSNNNNDEDEDNEKQSDDEISDIENNTIHNHTKEGIESSDDHESSTTLIKNRRSKDDELDEHNLDIDPIKHGEIIYRIKDRIILTGLHPV